MTARKGYAAGVAALLWLFGFDVAPMAHMVLHDALEAHEHGHRHRHVQDHGHEHRHVQDHGHEHGDGSGHASEQRHENENGKGDHGEGSVAHRDLAAQVPLPSLPEVLEALLSSEASPLPSHDEQPADRRPRTSRARAPPSVAA